MHYHYTVFDSSMQDSKVPHGEHANFNQIMLAPSKPNVNFTMGVQKVVQTWAEVLVPTLIVLILFTAIYYYCHHRKQKRERVFMTRF